jgi:mono/diheme cytochrome c family protein
MRIRLKTVLLSLAVLILIAVIGGISMVGWQVVLGPDARSTSAEKFEPTEARLARGKYLAEGPAHCFFCHTEHDLTGPEPLYPIIQPKKGAGWTMPIPELNNIAARNITPDPETGIGTWTDDEVARAIREGVRKDGTALFPVMPYMEFRTLDDEDVKSIVVYLRTIPAVKNTVPTRQLPGPLEYIVKTMPKPLTTPQPSHPSATAVERGTYLATMATCAGCHTIATGGAAMPGMAFAGGQKFEIPGNDTPVFTANLTPDPSGIAHYDESLFIQTLRTGQMGGRTLNHVMPFEFFMNMTDEDLRDIFSFLRAQPPVKHRVSNTDPPTLCGICNQTHGLGELNAKK